MTSHALTGGCEGLCEESREGCDWDTKEGQSAGLHYREHRRVGQPSAEGREQDMQHRSVSRLTTLTVILKLSPIPFPGIQVSHGVSYHGLAINCTTELSWFSHITPCGVEGKEVTSLTDLTGATITTSTLLPVLAQQLADTLAFQLQLDNSTCRKECHAISNQQMSP